MNVFISYAREDREFVDQLFAKLQQNGINAWYDRALDGLIGIDYLVVIDQELKKSQAILVIISSHSIYATGVHQEVLRAQALEKRILPILIGNLKEKDLPHWIINKHYADGRNDRDTLPEILRSLQNTRSNTSTSFANSERTVPRGAISDLNFSLIIVPDGGRISGNRVGINAQQFGHNQVGIFTSYPDDTDFIRRTQLPVRLIPTNIVPENVIIISEGLRDELGFFPSASNTWQLEYQGFQLVPVQHLDLELTIEVPLEEAVLDLERSQDLVGLLIWMGEHTNQAFYESILFELSGRPYRVAKLLPLPNDAKVVLEITALTNLNIFSSSTKSGVDMVILADCSGSMGIEDLTDVTEHVPRKSWGIFSNKPKSKNIKRMEALKRSLQKLLDMRLRLSGRVSRVALVAFTHKSNVRFPRQGSGMSEIDGNSSPELISDFRGAISLLKAESEATDIGQALHYAAELLHKFGHPGNERLVVLISDGANWQPKGSDSTGEVVGGLEEPVSLMAHLHETMGIHLHAIGISNNFLFDQWMRVNHSGQKPEKWMIPDHDLLTRLVEVGGNDPSRTGDTDVLEEYFLGLGRGVTRKIVFPKSNPLLELQSVEKEIILAQSKRVQFEQILSKYRTERDELVQSAYEKYISVNEHAIALTGEALLTPSSGIESISLQLGGDVTDARACEEFVRSLINLVLNPVNKHPNDYDIPNAIKITSSSVSKDVQFIVGQLDKYFHSQSQQNTTIDLGQLGKQISGNSIIEYDDVEAWNKIQLHYLRKTSEILHQVQSLLFEKLVEEGASLEDDKEEKDVTEFRFIG